VDPSIEVIIRIILLICSSLNFILFALELLIIQPNIQCIPECEKNYYFADIFQRDIELFEQLIHETKNIQSKIHKNIRF